MEGLSLKEEVARKCMEIEEVKKSSLESKKKLAEETKILLGKSDEEKISGFTNLLKMYMAEIDALSRRAKTSEGFVLGLGEKVESELWKESEIGNMKVLKKEEEISGLKQRLEMELNSSKKTRESMQMMAQEKDAEISSLRSEIARMHAARASEGTDVQVQQALIEAGNEKVRNLEISLDEISGRLTSAETKIRQTEDKFQGERERAEIAEGEMERLKIEIAELRKFQESENFGNSRNPEISAGHSEAPPMLVEKQEILIGNLKSEISDRDRKIQKLERDLLRLEETVRSSAVAPSETIQAVSAAQTQRDRFRSRMLELEAERDDLRRALDRKNFQMTASDERPRGSKYETGGGGIFAFVFVNRKIQLTLVVYVVTLHLLVLSTLARLASVGEQ